MDDNIIRPNFITTQPVPVGQVLDGAKDADLDTVFVVGREKDGKLYLASSHSDVAQNNLMLDEAKAELISFTVNL